MGSKLKIGLLPLYLELYDKAMPEARGRMESFYGIIAAELEKRGLEVLQSRVCRLKGEFADAIHGFEAAGADAIVTLHLAYSPSLESADALARTKLPILVLDTTPTHSYGPNQDPGELMYNHGIHGVQDMCNLLVRNGKPFRVEAGHWEKSDALDRVAAWMPGARIARAMRTARVGRIGEPFRGMGDFGIPSHVLRTTIGIETLPCDPVVLRSQLPTPNDPEVEAELSADRSRFSTEGLLQESHRRSIQAGIAVRRWVEKEKLCAFTANFLAVDRASGIPTVPFLEASKAMARGVGYAGEGDVLTAALVGALAASYPETTFTEMFCPDWAGESIFLSHMGEMNLSLSAETPLLMERPFPWTDADPPVVAVGRLKPGEACLVNLAPGPQESYRLIVAPVTMLDGSGNGKMADSIRGWFRPRMPIADFLAEYSHAGGTHHLALVYGDVAGDVRRFGELMGWKVIEL